MANANAAVMEALRPIAALVVGPVQAGNTVTLDASGSAAACHASVASYAWTVSQSTTNPPPTIQNANSAMASIVAPTAPDTYTLMLTVTDNAGRTDTASVVLTSSSKQTSAPASAGSDACLAAVSYTVPPPTNNSAAAGGGGSHGGGGGALDVLSLLALAGCALGYCSSRCAASSQVRCARR